LDKFQSIHSFWSSFGVPAYNRYSVPDDAAFPYITYETAIGSLDDLIPLSASIWYKSTSLADLSRKTEEIYNYIVEHNPVLIKIDGGYLWIFKNGIFAQDQSSGVDNVKAKYITIYGEFLTQ
jgi:hypothetical protein